MAVEQARVGAMVAFVRARLKALMERPDAWGPPEAVELQVLLLLEMWHVAAGASREQVDGLLDRYHRYLAAHVPGPPIALAMRLSLSDRANARFVDALQEFIASEIGAFVSAPGLPLLPIQDRAGAIHFGEA